MAQKLTLEEIVSRKPLKSGLTPIGFAPSVVYPSGTSRRQLLCSCICGNVHSVDISYFINGRIISCGCLMIALSKATRLTVSEINFRKPEHSKLTVLEFVRDLRTPSRQIKKEYLCQCDCGNTCLVTSLNIISGNTTSCGCKNTPEIIAQRVTKAFPVNKILRQAYYNMIGRCYNQKHISYRYYGAKGVMVCEEWINSYSNFLSWSLNNGWKEGLRLDKDIKKKGNKIYGPDTCLWVTPTENSRHTSRNIKFLYKGELFTIKQIEEITGLKENKILPLVFKEKISVEESINKLINHD